MKKVFNSKAVIFILGFLLGLLVFVVYANKIGSNTDSSYPRIP